MRRREGGGGRVHEGGLDLLQLLVVDAVADEPLHLLLTTHPPDTASSPAVGTGRVRRGGPGEVSEESGGGEREEGKREKRGVEVRQGG